MILYSHIIDHDVRFFNNFANAQTNIRPYLVQDELLNYIQAEFLKATPRGGVQNEPAVANGAENSGGQVLQRADNLNPELYNGSNPVNALINMWWNPTTRITLHMMPAVFWGLEKLYNIR